MEFLVALFKLLVSHALCDFSLQTPWMASTKNRHNKPQDNALPPGQTPAKIWPYVLSAHALIHAGGALVATGSAGVAAVVGVLHWWTDFAKCENWTTVHVDQAIHFFTLVGAAYYVAEFPWF